jgi:hypothetical protein
VSNDRLNVKVVSNQNSVELTKSENKVVVTDKKQDTAVNVTQKETAVVTIVSKGPKGDKGDTGDIGTTITNQIATGSITASVNIGADTFRVQSGSSTFFTINSSSNAGLGSNITIPTGEFGLSIYNTTTTPHTIIVGTDIPVQNYPRTSSVVIGGINAHLDLYNPDDSVAANELIGAIRFRNNDTANISITKAQIAAYATDSTPDGYLVFSTQQNPNALAERMRITNTGLVGIGTITPTNTLEVNGGITATSITSSLLGTSSWAQSASSAVSAQTASFLSGAFIQNGNSFGTTAVLGTNDTNNLELETGGTTRVFISASGNVGIGTPTPTERLHVDGNLLVTGRITAEEFHTEFISSSIIYQSGSTQFGNSSDDTHIFTGSLYVTASLAQFSNEVRTGFLSSSYIDINTTAGITQPIEGRLSWNNTDGTLDIGLKGGNIALEVGQDQVARVVNKTDANLLKSEYKVVRIRTKDEGGAQGQRLAIKLSQANNDPNSVDTLGLVAENIDNNQEGYIITSGLVHDINTTGTLQGETWYDGDVLYLSPTTAGALTNIKPIAPNHTIIIGFVVYSHNNQGKIFVKVDNGYEIDELHNVRIITSSLSSGDLLVYSGSVWTNSKQLSGSYGLTGSLTTTGDITTQNLIVANITASENIRIGRTKSVGGNNFGTYNPILTYWNDGVSGAVQSASFGFRGSAYMDSIAYPDIFGFGTNDLRFFASTNGIATPSEIVRIVGSTGFVGIGETSPSAKLEIKGSTATSAATALRVENNNATSLLTILNDGTSAFNTNHLYVSSSGRIGIGTTTPQSQLHITGANALFTLSPLHPLPTSSVPSASFATSGSGANLKPYFWNGSSWNALY